MTVLRKFLLGPANRRFLKGLAAAMLGAGIVFAMEWAGAIVPGTPGYAYVPFITAGLLALEKKLQVWEGATPLDAFDMGFNEGQASVGEGA